MALFALPAGLVAVVLRRALVCADRPDRVIVVLVVANAAALVHGVAGFALDAGLEIRALQAEILARKACLVLWVRVEFIWALSHANAVLAVESLLADASFGRTVNDVVPGRVAFQALQGGRLVALQAVLDAPVFARVLAFSRVEVEVVRVLAACAGHNLVQIDGALYFLWGGGWCRKRRIAREESCARLCAILMQLRVCRG